jgi:chromate transporter
MGSPASAVTDEAARTEPRCSLRELVLYFLRLGTLGFGGPIALAGNMQRDLVEHRKWFDDEDYKQGLALAQLSPGPLAAQLAMYLGWVRGGAFGAAAVGFAFVLPSFVMVIVLALLYLRFHGLSWMVGLFYGIGAAVIAIIARSAVKLARTTLARDVLLWALFVATGLLTAVTEKEYVSLFLAAGLVTMFVKAPPRFGGSKALMLLPPFLVTGAHGPASNETLARVAWFFTKAGAFVFGSGLAIVPFLYQGVVHEYRWLDEAQFRDAVAVAMITPGPVVITSGFIGYLTAGLLGALVAAAGTFLPPYLVVVLAARPMRKATKNASFRAFVSGVIASSVGAIAGSAFILGRRAIVDVPTAAIAVAALAALSWKTKKIPEPLIIAAAGAIGLALHSR